MTSIVIAGASLAGVRTAEGLRNKGFDGAITLVGDEADLPYDRPPLSKSALTKGESAETLAFHPESWYPDNGIDLRLGERALHLDPQRGSLRTTLSEIEFDDLVIATGARPRNPFPKAPDGVFTLRTLTDAHLLRERLRSCRHLVVIGGGFIGLEVAASARASGVDVTVVEVAEIPLSRNLGASVAPILGDLARDHGVRLICGRSVADLEGTDRIERVVLDDGQAIDADLVVVGVGAVPNVEWLDGSGLDTSAAGVHCDPTGRAGHRVWAVGDAACWADANGVLHRHEHWTSATEQARIVAHNLIEDEKRTLESVGYVWSDQFGRRIDIIGDTTGDATVRFLSRTPDHLAALYSRDDRLVGACIVSQPRLMIKCRKWIADRTEIGSIPEWQDATA